MERKFLFLSLFFVLLVTSSCSQVQKCIDGYTHVLSSDGKYEPEQAEEPLLVSENGLQINKYPPVCCDGYSIKYNLEVFKYECKSDCNDCGANAKCDKTKKCVCNKGSSRNSSGKCEKICNLNCVNGFCASPDSCQCDEGLVPVGDNVCGVDDGKRDKGTNVNKMGRRSSATALEISFLLIAFCVGLLMF